MASGFGSESEVERERLAAADGDFFALCAVGFMPSSNNIMARRKVREREAAVFVGDGKVTRLHDDKVAIHPRMYVAFDMDELFLIVRVGKRGRTRRLHLIPFAVDFSERVNIVSERIAV